MSSQWVQEGLECLKNNGVATDMDRFSDKGDLEDVF